jgi:integrase
VHWVRRYVLYHGKRPPWEMGEREVAAFLTHLAVEQRVAASTQNQAFAGLQFLYASVIGRPLGDFHGVVRAKRPQRLPEVLTVEEVRKVLEGLSGERWLIGMLLYGAGLRLLEALRLRVKDVDLERCSLTIREAKGNKDRVTVLPQCLRVPLERHLGQRRVMHALDAEQGRGRVVLPGAFNRKSPTAEQAWPGSGSFRRGRISGIARPAGGIGTICTRRWCSGRSGRRWCGRGSRSGRRATRFAIHSRRTSWRMVTTFARCRSSWGTMT